MQRKDGSLQRQTNDNKAKPRLDGAVVMQRVSLQDLTDISHIERSGRRVEKADTDHEEAGANRAQDQIVERRWKCAPILRPTKPDQHIGGDR